MSGPCHANNASTDDDHSGDESGEKREREPKLDRADAIGSGNRRSSWINRLAAGVTMASVCVLLVGGWLYFTREVRL